MAQNNNFNQNFAKIYTGAAGGELYISTSGSKQAILATNNKALYYSEQAKKYRDEAKEHRDNAKFYAEQNSDVTAESVNNIRAELLRKIETKQDSGNYALKSEIPTGLSQLENDSNYVIESDLETFLPEQINNEGKFLMTNGNELSWNSPNSFSLFDTKLSDHILNDTESIGWALQGTFVYKSAVAGTNYGYPDFYAKCLEEYNEATGNETVNGVTIKVHTNGHKFYNIADKDSIDDFYNTMGTAWFYGIDTNNECIFLPRNKYLTSFIEDGKYPVAGNGNILTFEAGYDSTNSGTANYIGLGRSTASGDYGTVLYNLNGDNFNSTKSENPLSLPTQVTPHKGTAYGGVNFIGLSQDSDYSGIEANITTSQNGMYLYICIGNTVSATSWIDIITQVEGGVKDLDDKTNEGLKALSNASEVLRQCQITNCLLEVPQNIKLELADGVLTLKAGSTYILPNGKDNFEHITISEDLTRNKFGNGSHENLYIQMYIPNSTGIGGLSFAEPRNITVGTEQPASGMWYNTTTNQIINYTSSGAEDAIRSFPIAVVKTESGIVTEIKEVLNGIGHFGSVIFADKGIKCLIPNGRNEDGTLNNIEFKTDKVLVHNITENKTGWGLYLSSSHLTKSTAINYDDLSNYNIHPTLGNYLYCQIGTFDTSSTNFAVSNFKVKEPFKAIDCNDFNNLKNGIGSAKAYITETYINGTSGYNIYSNGFCEQWGEIDGAGEITFLIPMADTTYTRWVCGDTSTNTASGHNYMYNRTTTSAYIQGFGATAWGVAGYKA